MCLSKPEISFYVATVCASHIDSDKRAFGAQHTAAHTQTRRSHGGKPGSWKKPRRRKNAPLAHNVLNLSGAHVHAITNLSLCPLHNQTTDLIQMRTHRKPSPARPESAPLAHKVGPPRTYNCRARQVRYALCEFCPVMPNSAQQVCVPLPEPRVAPFAVGWAALTSATHSF